jgi:hypothetical protein
MMRARLGMGSEMKGKLFRLSTMAFCLLLSSTTMAVTKVPTELWLKADIVIDADGRIASLEWREDRKPLQAIARKLEPEVRDWTFEPGTVQGVPAETSTRLTVRLGLDEADDGAVAVRIRGAHTGAYIDALTPPRYPPEGFRRGVEANIVSTIEVSADGNVSIGDMDFTGSRDQIARDDFLEAAKAAILTWRVQPEHVGGHAVATRMQIPMSFCIDTGGKWCAKHAFREAKGGPVPPETPIALESAVRLLNLPADREI